MSSLRAIVVFRAVELKESSWPRCKLPLPARAFTARWALPREGSRYRRYSRAPGEQVTAGGERGVVEGLLRQPGLGTRLARPRRPEGVCRGRPARHLTHRVGPGPQPRPPHLDDHRDLTRRPLLAAQTARSVTVPRGPLRRSWSARRHTACRSLLKASAIAVRVSAIPVRRLEDHRPTLAGQFVTPPLSPACAAGSPRSRSGRPAAGDRQRHEHRRRAGNARDAYLPAAMAAATRRYRVRDRRHTGIGDDEDAIAGEQTLDQVDGDACSLQLVEAHDLAARRPRGPRTAGAGGRCPRRRRPRRSRVRPPAVVRHARITDRRAANTSTGVAAHGRDPRTRLHGIPT